MSSDASQPPSGTGKSTEPVRNVLFIMSDQLRLDALSCYGGVVDTPNLDRLAARGVRFDSAYVQGAVCGSSRMSFYTGRYVHSHGARYNRIPLAIGQRTLGDHLASTGITPTLVGKTHFAADEVGLERLGLDPEAPGVLYLSQCGFDPDVRDDGLQPSESPGRLTLPYNEFLRRHGYQGDNPWHTAANSVLDDEGKRVSGWLLRSADHPAIVPDELSETAWMTDRAIDFIRRSGDERWCLHLSYIKPHWPYVVSEPWHQLVHRNDLPAPVRSDAEQSTEHPVVGAFQQSRIGRAFSRDDVRASVYPAYLGLVAQLDHHLGRLFDEMADLGRLDDTMIVFTSDHGDYLGDHWMGDKYWLHEPIVNVPLLIADPRPTADVTRGTGNDQIVEAIDVVPTLVDALGADTATADAWLEGQSLCPLLAGSSTPTDRIAVCETDYGYLEFAATLPDTGGAPQSATMLRTDRYKYVLDETGPNLLYDLGDDPHELVDRGGDSGLADVEADLHDRLFEWFRARTNTVTDNRSSRRVDEGSVARAGVFIGYVDEAEVIADGAGHLL